MKVCVSYTDPGFFARGLGEGGSRPDSQKTALTTFFSPQLILQFYRGCPRFKRVQHFPGGTTFSRGGGGGGGGPNANFYRNPYTL